MAVIFEKPRLYPFVV